MQDYLAEHAAAADRAGMTAFRGMKSIQPARLLSYLVNPQDAEDPMLSPKGIRCSLGKRWRRYHENKFARVLINKSIRQLAESLLAYRKLMNDTEEEFGEDAFLDGQTSEAARKELKQELTRIDPAAMKAGCFWHGELKNLDANAG
jgi:hypothetical protein